ncbi:MAG: DUF2905 domain-containing protein [Myxococcales bacterium]
MLIVAGALLVAVGLVLLVGGKYLNFGRLPGDVRIERPGWSFHFPVVTMLLVSVALTLLLNVVLRLTRR